MWKRLALIPLGAVVGALLAFGVAELWHVIQPPTRRLTAADKAHLEALLNKNPKAIFMFDEATSYRYKPGFRGIRTKAAHLKNRPNVSYTHTTNSLGLLGTDEVNPSTRVPKVLVLGDSVTYGAWVDYHDSFPQRLQQQAGQPARFSSARVKAGAPNRRSRSSTATCAAWIGARCCWCSA